MTKRLRIITAATLMMALGLQQAEAAKYNSLTSIRSGGKDRQYFLYVPDGITDNRPLIISCHGMNQDYSYQKDQTQWPLLADTANFVVAYPVGVPGSAWGINYVTGWDMDGMTDVNFMLDIVDDLAERYHIDRSRVYLSGFSLGGAFVYHVINKCPEAFAAFAPISGYQLMGANYSSSRPVPIIHVHGTNDGTMPYSGIKDYIKKWAATDNCQPTAKYTEGNGYEEYRYIDGDCETEVVLYSVKGRDHEPSNEGFHTSNAIWNFCRQYTNGCGKIKDEPLKGDVDDNGSVNSADIVSIYNYILIAEESGITLSRADVDNNGEVNSGDVVAVFNIIIET